MLKWQWEQTKTAVTAAAKRVERRRVANKPFTIFNCAYLVDLTTEIDETDLQTTTVAPVSTPSLFSLWMNFHTHPATAQNVISKSSPRLTWHPSRFQLWRTVQPPADKHHTDTGEEVSAVCTHLCEGGGESAALPALQGPHQDTGLPYIRIVWQTVVRWLLSALISLELDCSSLWQIEMTGHSEGNTLKRQLHPQTAAFQGDSKQSLTRSLMLLLFIKLELETDVFPIHQVTFLKGLN